MVDRPATGVPVAASPVVIAFVHLIGWWFWVEGPSRQSVDDRVRFLIWS